MKLIKLLLISTTVLFFNQTALANDDTKKKHQIKIGYAKLNFNVNSGELTGDLTPPGLTGNAPNSGTMAFTYDYHFDNNWSFQFAGGYPPEVDLEGLLNGDTLGVIGSAKALFPGVLGIYHMDISGGDFYIGAGVNYTFYVDAKATDFYDATVGGNSTDVDIDDSFGGIFKMGYEYPITDSLNLDLSYAKYWVSANATLTTDTPGVGDVVRTVDLDINPDVFFVMVSYYF